jgi:hypothetical protein
MSTLYRGQLINFRDLAVARMSDEPSLHLSGGHVIQTAHLLLKDLLQQEAWSDSVWLLKRITSEQIPILYLVEGDAEKMVDWCESKRGDGLWVTPKNHPREEP